jgi:hypothetical protein
MKKNKFSEKADLAFSRGTAPVKSIGDFLDNTDVRKPVSTATRKPGKRFELKLPDDLAETLRFQAFQTNTTKTAIVISALKKYFEDGIKD